MMTLLSGIGRSVIIVLAVLLIPDVGLAGQQAPAQDILKAARKAAAKLDPQAWMVKAEYSRGDRKCRFASARFDFASPRLIKTGQRKNCFRVYVSSGVVSKIREVSSYQDKAMPSPDPAKVLPSVLGKGFGQWWERNKQAWLYMDLMPESGRYGTRCPGGSYLWKIMGSGPGINEDYILYLNASTLSVCEEKIKRHNMNSKEIRKSLKKTRQILKK